MKNKPLALFTGAALATLAALTGLKMTNWPAGSTASPEAAKSADEPQTPAAEEVSKAPEKSAATSETAALPAAEPPKAETAAVPAAEPPNAETAAVPAAEPPKAETAAVPPAEPPKAETAAVPAAEPQAEPEPAAKPELDTVRVESDGQAIVAGRARPGAEIALRLGDQVIGKGVANADGSWVVVPDHALPKGAHEILIEQKAADSAAVIAEQSIAVAVPEKPGQQAMVALTEPGAATKVLQSGGIQEPAVLPGTTQPAPPEPKAPEATVTPGQLAQEAPKAEEPAVAAQEAPKPEEAVAVQNPPQNAKPAGETQEPASQTTTVAKSEEFPEAVRPPEEAPAKPAQTQAALDIPLRLDAVDYNDKGDIIFSGRAKPGTAVRLYVDNRGVGDAMVDGQGGWTFAGKDIIAPGTHDLRADQIDKTGKVVARIELPFLRENAEAVAALNTPDLEGAEVEPIEAEPSPQAEEARPAENTAEQSPHPAAEQSQATVEHSPLTTAEQPPQPASEQPQPQQADGSPKAEPTPEKMELAKAGPEASGPAPEQPVTENMTQNVQTAEPTPMEVAKAGPEASGPAPEQTVTEHMTQYVQTAEPLPAEMAQAGPEVSVPAPEQPVTEIKTQDVKTAAAISGEQAARAMGLGKPRSGKIVIQPGNNLWKLSRVIYGRGLNFTVIYQANKDQIRDPDWIYPGQIFAIPNASPPEKIDPKRKDPLTSAEGGVVQ